LQKEGRKMNTDRAQLISLREAADKATPGAVIRALFSRLSPDAQQELVDWLQAQINANRTARAVDAARAAMGGVE
jgi:hypothetical protein